MQRDDVLSMEERSTSALEALLKFCHASLHPQLISGLASQKGGFGTGWLMLQLIKQERIQCGLPISSLDLSEFLLDAGKLGLLLSSFPVGSDFLLETLKGGAFVCNGRPLFVLNRFLRRATISASLKNLDLSKCDLSDRAGGTLLHSLPSSLECLNLNENRLRSLSMEALRSALSEGSIPKLLSLDVSNNPLGPSGVSTLAGGLSGSEGALPLQTLKLSKTAAKAEGVKALSASFRNGKAPFIQVLDLGGNDMRAEGVGWLAGAVGEGALSALKVLILKENNIAKKSEGGNSNEEDGGWDFGGLTALFANEFPSLHELDLSDNELDDHSDDSGGASMIGEALEGGRLGAVRKLNLARTGLSEIDLSAVFDSLATGLTPHLECFLSPKLSTWTSQALASSLDSGHLSQLKELWLNDSESEGLNVVMRSIASGHASSLSTLKIESEYIEEGDLDEILGGVTEGLKEEKLGSLEDLDLNVASGGVSPEVLRDFGRSLGAGKASSSLRKLSLSWFDDRTGGGVAALAQGLGSGSLGSLEHLSLSAWCGSREGCRELGGVLSAGNVPSLRFLDVSSIQDNTFLCLFEGFGERCLSPEVVVEIRMPRNPFIREDDLVHINTGRMMADVIRAGKIPRLRKIVCEGAGSGPIDCDGARMFGESLTYRERGVGASGAASACLPFFEELDFTRCFVGIEGPAGGEASLLRGIVSGGGLLPSLHTLRIGRDPEFSEDPPNVGVPVAHALADCISKAKFPSLRSLRFPSPSIGHAGMQALTHALCSPHAKILRSLSVNIGSEAEVASVSALSVALSFGQLNGLQELTLHGDLFSEGLSALSVGVASGNLRCLRSLELPDAFLGKDEGTRALCQALSAEHTPDLRCLSLGRVDDASLKTFAKEWVDRDPPPLEKLDLWGGSSVGDDGLVALASLAETGRLPFLSYLKVKLHGAPAKKSVIAMLKAVFPNNVNVND